ncbi:kinase-like protein [Coniochaeta sp. PMI_546]|nr:kinase-like protein [Coniochaeta sp. PMI_546]
MARHLGSLGGSCFISSPDKKTALKGYQVWEGGKCRAWCQHESEKELAREAFLYKHLGEHPHILHCYGLEEVHPGINSLRLEYAPYGDVRTFIQKHKEEPLPRNIRLRMALDTALGLSYVHVKGVQHCDMTCRNLFLFDNYRLKIGDFGGSLVEGHEELKPGICEEAAYELPLRGREFESRPGRKRELFALGSAIYEIMAWASPYQGLTNDEIEQKYTAEEFPALESILAGDIVRMCWHEKYDSADEVVEALKLQLQDVILTAFSAFPL